MTKKLLFSQKGRFFACNAWIFSNAQSAELPIGNQKAPQRLRGSGVDVCHRPWRFSLGILNTRRKIGARIPGERSKTIFISNTCLSDGLMHSVCTHPSFGAPTRNRVSLPTNPFWCFPQSSLPKKAEKSEVTQGVSHFSTQRGVENSSFSVDFHPEPRNGTQCCTIIQLCFCYICPKHFFALKKLWRFYRL